MAKRVPASKRIVRTLGEVGQHGLRGRRARPLPSRPFARQHAHGVASPQMGLDNARISPMESMLRFGTVGQSKLLIALEIPISERSRRHVPEVRQEGRLVYVSGKLQTRKWRKDAEDSDRTTAEILLVPRSTVQFLDK